MQTLETRAIVEPEGWYLTGVALTKSGLQKVQDAFEWHYRGGWAIAEDRNAIHDPFFGDKYFEYSSGEWKDWALDIESEALGGLHHPIAKFNDEIVEFVEGVDYVLSFQNFESDRLERLAYELNALHDTMQEEMNRLGW